MEHRFFGEMMRFTCCTHDFTTKIIGPQTYVVGAFYQESGNMEFHLTGQTPSREHPILIGSLDEPAAALARGRISISGVKHCPSSTFSRLGQCGAHS